ncbi:hypothetical protein [Hymenobacter yonginensis]|uniref:Uncharacterized protein n=1 Tax=Hymenobacter yonginensis TaxID=748197 RepID=A0ABY7PT41_9BACT|nr:hypothetical protein [Hymenobacter yonginensis]WBO86080.1 hypothetical protein O9Z63_07445 [Hymenobacter yonginensis]
MKKLFYIVGCLLVLGSSPAFAVADDPAVIIVRVHESLKGAHLVIERGAEKPEVIDFVAGNSASENASAAKGYHSVISKLYQQGYVLQSTITGASLQGGTSAATYSLSTLVFIKGPKL